LSAEKILRGEMMVKKNEPLIYDPSADMDVHNIRDAAKAAIELSKANKRSVRFNFNGASVRVDPDPDLTVEDVVKSYHDAPNAFDEYQNSPEGKAATKAAEEERKLRDAAVDQKIKDVKIELSDAAFWKDFIEANKEDDYGSATIRYAERWARLMQAEMASGKKLENVVRSTSDAADNENISGYGLRSATALLCKTWKYGAKLKAARKNPAFAP
jgi:hypothetical protein